jgi:hypothetical protein
LRLSDDDFLALSYRQFKLLHDRHQIIRAQDQWQLGAIYAAVCNHGFREYKKNRPKPDDITFVKFPGHKAKKTTTPQRRNLTHEKNMQIANFFRALAGPEGSLTRCR